ncbi:MAG: dodecin domain-containing protein [Gammaproteobacteria bacterium]|nr:dodecin domain-containing protein [Gammaproteobacteria bacterium]
MLKHTKSNELIGTSQRSFEDALQTILARANQTLRGVRCLDVIAKDLEVSAAGELTYRVRAQLRFDVTPPDELHL